MRLIAYSFVALVTIAGAAAIAATNPSTPQTCNYDSWISQGNTFATSGQCKKAIGAYGRAILCKPLDPWAFYYRGLVRQGLGESVLSKKDLNQANEFGAKNSEFQNRRKPADGAPETFAWFFPGAQCQK